MALLRDYEMSENKERSKAELRGVDQEGSTARTEAHASYPHARYFRISVRGDSSARGWDITEGQAGALIQAAEAGIAVVAGVRKRGVNRALQLLRAMLRNAPLPREPHPEYTRLHLIADSLESYANDEGGFSNETREAIASDAAFLRLIAGTIEPGYAPDED